MVTLEPMVTTGSAEQTSRERLEILAKLPREEPISRWLPMATTMYMYGVGMEELEDAEAMAALASVRLEAKVARVGPAVTAVLLRRMWIQERREP
jgi:hypothetical protein